MRSGMFSITGRPNVGKSTLLNRILDKKVAIISDKSGTTRNIILGVYNDSDSQIIFVDTPGIHKPHNKLGSILNKKAYIMTNDADVILFVVDISKGLGKGDEFIIDKFRNDQSKVILILNKIDQIDKNKLLEEINKIKDLYEFLEIIPVSAKNDINIKELIKTLKKYLPNEGKYYEDNFITNQPNSLIITERVREKIFNMTFDEIPHSITCVLETYEELDNIINMGILIIVDRDNLKKIIIGKNGSMLKKIGTSARIELEEYFNKKIFLSLYVKTIDDWRNREHYLNELGLKQDLTE